MKMGLIPPPDGFSSWAVNQDHPLSDPIESTSTVGEKRLAPTPTAREDATRNLVLGVLCVVIGVPIAGIALSWAGREAFVALATAVTLGLVVFLSIQARLFRQRNGIFLLLSLGLLLTVSIPVAVKLFVSGSELAQLVIEASREKHAPVAVAPMPAQAPLPTVETAPKPAPRPVDATPAPLEPAVAQKPAVLPPLQPSIEKAPVQPPSDIRPDEDPQQRATRLAKDEAVRRYPALTVPGSPEHSLYLEAYNELARLRKFDFFKDSQWPLKLAESVAQREGWKRMDQSSSPEASQSVAKAPKAAPAPLPGEELHLDGPQAPVAADPVAQATNRAIIEVRRRYPALGHPGSPENQIYLESYKELERLRPDFFEKPEWPIHLAEIVAKREGWRRQDGGEATAVAPPAVDLPLPK